MEINKNMKLLALIIGLMVVGGVVTSVVGKQLRREKEPKDESTPIAEMPVGNEKLPSQTEGGKLDILSEPVEKVKVSTRVEEGIFKIFVEPVERGVSLSAFALRLNVEGGRLAGDGKLILVEELLGAGWSFPIASAKEVGGGVEIKLSGVFVSTQKYDLTGSIELARVVVKSMGGLEVALDTETTRFFIKDGRQIEVEGGNI